MLGTLVAVLGVVVAFLMLRPESGPTPPGVADAARSVENRLPPETSREAEVAVPVVPREPERVSAPASPRENGAVDRSDHIAFVREYLARQSTNDVNNLTALYADRVRYYRLPAASRADIADDKAYYFRRWPDRSYRLASPVRATAGREPVLRFEYEYAVANPADDRYSDGRAWAELTLAPDGGTHVITSERGGTY